MNKSIFLRALLLGALCVTAPIHADETYYRWLDEQGETKISDRPPAPGVDYEIVTTRSTFSQTVSGEGEAEEEPAEDDKAGNQANAEWCRIARENLETLKTTKRVTMRDESGELKLLSKEEQDEQIARTQEQVNAYCEE